MSLDQQVEALVREAPQDGSTPVAVAAIAPALVTIAQQLQHLDYYLLQSLQGNWQITTLQHRSQPEQQKRVIYAYADVKDATHAGQDPHLVAKPMAIIQLLFHLISLPEVDSLLVNDTPGELSQPIEIKTDRIKQLVQTYLQEASQLGLIPTPNPRTGSWLA
jgi:hypothetical protein